MAPRIVGVAALVLRGDEVLLIRNRKRNGSIEIPCGKQEPGESLEKAAARELLEEAGLDALEVTFMKVKEMGHYHVHIFSIRVDPSAQPVAGDDAEEAWFGAPELLLQGSHPEDYALVQGALRPSTP